ncbi:3-oxoadipate enol-lactonase [Ponticoccus sp. SC2-23]|uniref:3-oxoadipate enol-lactonase n=1 Tax=Alexandriicola marinus TaxID=2081710 RepID=UPI000FD6FAA3|nr:3-oxoadipate enol-lactonase [Alexandriicola marinus]MBM1222208.1 3-oxoadipate enol-lactonase [Ponticoccus sp. SC6-9]MBM1226895.1 3-oxoadipate enol-lactonase [Ponticoccus sp. SC6-15]MBM1231155.1 3-oxoadipate enol-lactonase [Ponticoccus sp. SC6-38]MBM1235593.1 3-oxoadipate enol-lactonase [Ponticoccus sp. SC6-45]MBM1240177.1 3-oxoadipate enol-lactonase [Ponticoccus sp. SC6-49]MBM1244531.1 3-oxoadipate enol-lactonase [Ponticoccus sp. SC2-64]MBM1249067.1 3-oxoadipate enol-lactonase [Ponticoccu
MRSLSVSRDDAELYSRVDGVDDPDAPTIVFANSLGTDLTLWDPMLPHLPGGLRLIRYDKRGHGRSSVPPAPYSMGALVSDAEAVCDAWEVKDCLFVGLSVGGLIAQGLAVKRLDLVRGLVLSNTAAKIGTKERWQERIDAVMSSGMEAVADGVLERWFGSAFLASPDLAPWRALLLATPPEGYAGVCAAIAGTDFFSTTSGLRLPTMGIAGSEDQSTPPDMVRETTGLVPGSRFELIRKAGHLPCVEKPEEYAALLVDFMKEIGHV